MPSSRRDAFFSSFFLNLAYLIMLLKQPPSSPRAASVPCHSEQPPDRPQCDGRGCLQWKNSPFQYILYQKKQMTKYFWLKVWNCQQNIEMLVCQPLPFRIQRFSSQPRHCQRGGAPLWEGAVFSRRFWPPVGCMVMLTASSLLQGLKSFCYALIFCPMPLKNTFNFFFFLKKAVGAQSSRVKRFKQPLNRPAAGLPLNSQLVCVCVRERQRECVWFRFVPNRLEGGRVLL